MKAFLKILTSVTFLILLISCSTDPGSEDLTVDPIVLEQAAQGFEVNDIVSTSLELGQLTGNMDFIEQEDFQSDLLPSADELKKNAGDLIHLAAEKYKIYSSSQGKTESDSIVLFEDSPALGTRLYIGYDTESGILRLYSVKYAKFAPWQVKNYDSTEIKVNYNFTLDDGSDDKPIRIDNLVRYKESFFIDSVNSQVLVTDYEGTKASGLILTRDSYYDESRFLERLLQSVEINPDGSGTLREDFTFDDGSTAFNSITFFDDQTGEFSKQFRNGTTVSGHFDNAEMDGIGSWDEMINFPAGRYIDRINRDAQVNMSNDIFNAVINQQIIFSSGRIDSSSFDINIETENEVTTTVINVEKANGAYGTFTITESESAKNMDGEWSTWDGYYITSFAEWYDDGSSHLTYEVYAPPYQPGDDPLLTGEYYFSPDGLADGTIIHNGITYIIKLKDNLKGEISHDGKKAEFDLFQ